MAFNFNWSPLTADASFYTRAQELLTTALNKSPKPPIIVDDILVNELNLGSVPPDLEILEIGDLAEDRFRGIFRMCYTGDAFLTLKTRVQANPLNTYLSTKPSFTSPQPLAASSGLTIPLKITLSEIKLSAFIILVFSRQKGLTLVFRNDPLESLKVSSTFDAIPFVRDYLQKEIEGQLRTLLMDEVPVIIHRLSLRLWVPEYREREDEELARTLQDSTTGEKPVDPLASPPQDPVDISGNILDASQIASLSLDSGPEMHALFSQKNLLRLSALTDSHRTLSLFTPGIRDVVFRAWAGPTERGEMHGNSGRATPITPVMARGQSYTGDSSTTYIFSEAGDARQYPSRPGLSSFGSAASGLGLGSNKHGKPHGGRKRKHRVVNLRKKAADGDDVESVSGDSTTVSGTMSSAPSESGARPVTPERREGELVTPPRTPVTTAAQKEPGDGTPLNFRNLTPRPPRRDDAFESTPRPPQYTVPLPNSQSQSGSRTAQRPSLRPSDFLQASQYPVEKRPKPGASSSSSAPLQRLPPSPMDESSSGDMMAQPWLTKMAGEIARKVRDQKAADSGFWDRRSETQEEPPPAYGS
ncbi:MAG: ERMES complex subunit [Alectoria sarmentosa]|nr:MAG: ERMES complex subunit [Alectoria sarmentosa]